MLGNLSEHQDLSPWSRWKADVATRMWTSLVAACLEALAFFAYFDPLMQGSDAPPPYWLIHRPTAYAFGVGACWAFTMTASALNAILLDRASLHALGAHLSE
jgi:hypothetical protein